MTSSASDVAPGQSEELASPRFPLPVSVEAWPLQLWQLWRPLAESSVPKWPQARQRAGVLEMPPVPQVVRRLGLQLLACSANALANRLQGHADVLPAKPRPQCGRDRQARRMQWLHRFRLEEASESSSGCGVPLHGPQAAASAGRRQDPPTSSLHILVLSSATFISASCSQKLKPSDTLPFLNR